VQYQWLQDNQALPGEVGPVLSLTLEPDDSYTSFTVFVQNPCGEQISLPVPFGEITDVPICKLYECDAYENALLAFNTHSLWTFTGGLSETDGSVDNGATIYDRMGNNDLTVDGNNYFFTGGVVPDDCEGATSIGINTGTGTSLRRSGLYPPRAELPSTGAGIIGCVIKKGSSVGGGIAAEWTKTDTEDTGGSISISGFSGVTFTLAMQTLRFNNSGVYQGASTGNILISGFPTYDGTSSANIQVEWETVGSGTSAETIATAYAEWDRSVSYGALTVPGELNTSNLPHGSEISAAPFHTRMNHTFIKTAPSTNEDWDTMADAWAQNQPDYTDPNPNCRPPV